MNIYATEKEQIQEIKNWFKKYGTSIFTALLVVGLLFVGWQYWSKMKTERTYQASESYGQLQDYVENGNSNNVIRQANLILSQYSSTPYASLASLILAGEATKENKLAEAEKHLQWVISHSKDSAMQQVARIRAARVLLAEKKPQAALKVLNTVDDSHYAPLIDSTKANAYLALGDSAKARTLLTQALATMPKNSLNYELVLMRRNDL